MSYRCLQFLPKNERKQVDMRFHSSKVNSFVRFLGEIEETKKRTGDISGLKKRNEEKVQKVSHL